MLSNSSIDHHFNRMTGLFYMVTPPGGVPIEQVEEMISHYQQVISEWKKYKVEITTPECKE